MGPAQSELIDPRPGEEVDTARLLPYLRERLPGAEGTFALRQFAGGHANLTYLLRFGEREYVLRRPPLGPVAPSSHDMKREHTVLARLTDVFPLAPRSYLFCGDESVIGASFHVLERRHGIVVRGDLPEHFRDSATVRRMGEMLIDTLAALHLVKPESAALESLGRPEGFSLRQLEGWAKRWHAAKDRDLPAMDALAERLARSVPAPQSAALLHNDYKYDNMLVAADDPARAVAVLDWDMCTRGDPLMDLGALLVHWIEPGEEADWKATGAMPTWREGAPSRAEAVARYAAATGLDLGRVGWYHAFGLFKFAVIVQQIYIRYLRGQTRDARFAGFGERVAQLAERGRRLAEAEA